MLKRLVALSFTVALIMNLFLSLSIVKAQAPAALTNGSFETLDSSSMPTGWFFYSYKIRNKIDNKTSVQVLTDGKCKDGKNYVKITNGDSDDSRLAYSLAVKQNQKYKVTCWVKTENIPDDSKKTGANISLDANQTTSQDIKGTTDWTQIAFYFDNLQPRNVTLTLGIGTYYRDNSGTAYFDDVKVEEINDFPAGAKVATAGDKNNNSGTSTASKPSSLNTIIIVIAVIVVLGVVAAFLFIKRKPKAPLGDGEGSEDQNDINELGYANDVKPVINNDDDDDDDDTSL